MKPIDPKPLRDTRPSYVGFEWSPDGKRLAALALAENWRTRWVLAIDPATARTEVVDALHDPAWIGGPAWSRFGWLKDSERIWFTSEATGYSHLYVAHRTGRFRRQLTRGAFEVHNVRLSWDRERFLLITNERHPGERHLYVMDTEGGSPRLLTAAFAGIDDAAFGPDPKQLVVVHSTPTMPVSLSLLEVGAGNREPRVLRRIFRGATDSYLAGKWIAPRVVHFPDKHGNRVYARLYVPEKPHPLKPAVIHAHGAGYAQYAHRRWQSRPHTYLFSQYLLKKGYHVLDIDYRGSSGYGRDCRTEIYRYMGGSEIDSGEAAVDFLARACGVDPKRVGLFGGSYGGFYTLMALFTRPGLFRAGVALYPVTDWSHYNHWYTARILNLPQEDREAYHRSSPIYLARNLKDRLQIQHGVVDSNVHFQDTLRLVQRLIELKKTGWDVAVYPVEGHGWRTEASRLDSCRRMVGLFDEVLLAPGLD
jgi:dipeptidyl aminopeptidase/acylaminoacyl peptidase